MAELCQVEAFIHHGSVAILSGAFGTCSLCQMHRDILFCQIASTLFSVHDMLCCDVDATERVNFEVRRKIGKQLESIGIVETGPQPPETPDPDEGLDDYDDRLR